MLSRAEYRALLRRARVFVCAPRREDYGIAQLEALADGCLLVTAPSPGPYAALPLARELDARLVGGIAEGIRTALDDPRARLRRAGPSAAGAVAARGGRRGGARAAAAAVSLAGMTPISGQSVLITGAAHGIGAETARRLAARGARVSLVGLGDLEAVAADCPGSITFEADVTDRDALDAAVNGTVEAFGGIDTLFANAGIGAPGFVRSMDPEMFERVIEVNLIGVWRTIRACLPHVIERRGYILPVASMAAILPPVGLGAYGAAKSGVENLGHALRVETQHYGVDVGVAYFSWIDTEMVRGADRTELGASMRAMLTGPLAKHYPVSAAAEAVVRGIERRQRIVAVPRWLIGLMWLKPILPRLTERELRKDIARFDELAEREARERGNEPVGAGGEAERAARRVH